MNIVEAIIILKNDKNKLLETTLQFVQMQIDNTYKNIAKIHLLSAEQAFIGALGSNDSNSESRVGIGHLRDAFNAYQVYLDRKNIWFGIFTIDFNPITKTDIQLKTASLSSVIAIIYKQLNDSSNYLTWKAIAVIESKQYIQNRPAAIDEWKNAKLSAPGTAGRLSDAIFGAKDDIEMQEKYKEEIQFIKLFSEVIKEI